MTPLRFNSPPVNAWGKPSLSWVCSANANYKKPLKSRAVIVSWPPLCSSHLDTYAGLQALDDDGLDAISGQGFNDPQQTFENLLASVQGEQVDNNDPLNELGPLNDVVNALNPMASMFDSDVTVKGVKYDNDSPRSQVNEDGSITFSLPTEIEEIAFKNMRVKGADPQHSLGDIVISNIRFSDQSRITIHIRE